MALFLLGRENAASFAVNNGALNQIRDISDLDTFTVFWRLDFTIRILRPFRQDKASCCLKRIYSAIGNARPSAHKYTVDRRLGPDIHSCQTGGALLGVELES
jgi:hypothetical protein